MIVSMTGFGRAEGELNGRVYQVEVKSVNSRFLELILRLPKSLEPLEINLRNFIKKYFSRGKVSVSISIVNGSEDNGQQMLDPEKLKFYVDILKQLRKKINSKERIKLDHILKFEDVITFDQKEEMNDDKEEFIYEVVRDALENLNAMKKQEGEFLKTDILQRIESIRSESKTIFGMYSDNYNFQKEKLINQVNTIIKDPSKIDDKRIEFEIAMLSEKFDITEEITRIESHVQYFIDHVNSPEHSGRRLNFLIQELNREANTIASKSGDAIISQKVTFIKEELEKIREQVQNIE